MNGADPDGPAEWPIDRRSEEAEAPPPRRTSSAPDQPRRGRRFSPVLLALAGLLLVLLLLWLFAMRGNSDQDKLNANASSGAVQTANPEKLCASRPTYDLIKRELFRRAAQLRGSDQAAFDQLSAYATLRVENPVMESENRDAHAANCSGSVALDLPPGVGVVGGRRTLSADVDFTVQPAADGSGNVVMLRNADAIIAPLATLARTGAAAAPTQAVPGAPPQSTVEAGPQASAPAGPPPAQASGGEAAQPTTSAPPAPAHPSFDCANARTKGEIAVCSNAGLAALDRNMAAQYVRALSDASPEQKALLRRTRDRFLAYRDRCPNRSCIGDAYVGRMREIRDIMEGRWRPTR